MITIEYIVLYFHLRLSFLLIIFDKNKTIIDTSANDVNVAKLAPIMLYFGISAKFNIIFTVADIVDAINMYFVPCSF